MGLRHVGGDGCDVEDVAVVCVLMKRCLGTLCLDGVIG